MKNWKITSAVRGMINVLSIIAVVTIFSIGVILLAGAVGRLTHHPILGIVELATLLMAIIVFFSIARTQVVDQHVYIQVFRRLLPGHLQKVACLVALFLTLIFFVIITWATAKIGWQSFLIRETYFGGVDFPVWVTKLVIAVGCFSMFAYVLLQVIQAIRQLKKR